MAESSPHERPIDVWRHKLLRATPIFSRTVSEVTAVTGNARTSAKDLSKVVGQDASMATRLLRIAGSALFNLQRRNIDTIDTAVVLIGFDAVRELAVSLTLIEKVLKGNRHHRVIETMARGFHAATQAKCLACETGDPRPEEVFVAALLLELGRMAFWAHCEDEGPRIEQLVASGMPLAEAEERVLGFSTRELTAELTREWHLGDLLQTSVAAPTDEHPRVRAITLGHEVATTAERHGFRGANMTTLVAEIAAELNLDKGHLGGLVEANLDAAAGIASRYGVPDIRESLPQPAAPVAPLAAQAPTPDPALQLTLLQAIGDTLEQPLGLSELMALVLRGVHEGVGFDRTYFALLSSDRKELEVRYALGTDNLEIGTKRPFRTQGDVLSEVLAEGRAARLSLGAEAAAGDYLGWLSYRACVVMPIVVMGKPIGLLYADRTSSSADIDDDAFSAFRLFGQQAMVALSAIRG